MTDISQLVPSKTATIATSQRMPVRGVVSTPPVSLDALTMRVIVPGHSSDYDVECRWMRQANALPAALADCLVVFDETGAGTVVWWSGAVSPWEPGDLKTTAAAVPAAGWLACDGTSYLRVDYPDLFAAIGGASSPWGLPDGTHFKVPDLRDSFPLGASAGHALGSTGGEATHVLTTPEIPSHTHPQNQSTSASGGAQLVGASAGGSGATANGTTGATGGGGAHNNMPPFVAVNVHIKT